MTESTNDSPKQIVERFLDCLQTSDLDGAMELLATDVEYANTGLPTAHGRERVRRIFEAMYRLPGAGFEVRMHAITAEGPIVLTERTDILKVGKLEVEGWVCGRFDVHDGQIVLWRDRFDQLTFFAGMVKGLFRMGSLRVRARGR